VREYAIIKPRNSRFYQVAAVRAWITGRTQDDIDTEFLQTHTPLQETSEAAKRVARQQYDFDLRQNDPQFCRKYKQPRLCQSYMHKINVGQWRMPLVRPDEAA
jgi:hypothetical protein